MSFVRILCLLLWSGACLAQRDLITIIAPEEIAGTWTGTLSQDNSGNRLASSYTFELRLEYKDGRIEGNSFIADAPSKSKAQMSLTGKLDGDRVHLQEAKILSFQIIAHASWCIKTMNLNMEVRKGKLYLTGDWTGKAENGVCPPGKIELSKPLRRV